VFLFLKLSRSDPSGKEGSKGQIRTVWGGLADPSSGRQCSEDKCKFPTFTFAQPRKLNIWQYDYSKGQLPELIDVIIEEKASLFVCAVGVPHKYIVERLHKAGIPIMNVCTARSYYG
jgi:NAD(P)H-dependent flavin oxidoreductase YrpB (nitropropane dioxygenase family)